MKGIGGSYNLVEIIRTLNLILSVVAWIWLVFRRAFRSYSFATRLRNELWLLAFYWTTAALVGNVELLLKTNTSSRVVLATCALVMTIRILLHQKKDWVEVTEKEDQPL